MKTFQEQTVAMLIDIINDIDDRNDEYRQELIVLVSDIIKTQRDFDSSITGRVVPIMKDKIDAFSQICADIEDKKS